MNCAVFMIGYLFCGILGFHAWSFMPEGCECYPSELQSGTVTIHRVDKQECEFVLELEPVDESKLLLEFESGWW